MCIHSELVKILLPLTEADVPNSTRTSASFFRFSYPLPYTPFQLSDRALTKRSTMDVDGQPQSSRTSVDRIARHGRERKNEMITIVAGQATLSDRRTQRSWSVELAPYQLAAFPITQARHAQITSQWPSTTQGDQLPVEGVSWLDAVRFCNALSQFEGLAPAYRLHADVEGIEWDASTDGYRLPTEATRPARSTT
jgi:hypothetical protein